MKWQPGSRYEYRVPTDEDPGADLPHVHRWRTAECVEDTHTGVKSLLMEDGAVCINQVDTLAAYEWREAQPEPQLPLTDPVEENPPASE